jgi:alpha-ketoglutaric semialdehyde dehydrogenase
MQHTALLLVDLQEDFLCHAELVPGRSALIDAVSVLLAWARDQSVPVLHAHTRVQADGIDAMPHWQRRAFIPCTIGSAGIKPPLPLQPERGEPVFYKRFFDPFEDPALFEVIRQRHISRLLVAGVHTHACIRQAVLSAYAGGLEVLLVTDAIASYDSDHAQKTLTWLLGRAASPVTTESLTSTQLQQEGDDDAKITIHSPCDAREVVFSLTPANVSVMNAALVSLVAAQAGQPASPALRAEPLARWHDVLLAAKSRCVDLLVQDLGKPLRDAQAEFDYGLALLKSAILQCHSVEEPGLPTVNYRPLGLVGIITPWNNPFALAVGKIAPALGFGNVVAWKPALPAWRISLQLLNTLEAAGLSQFLALLPGGAELGERLVVHPQVAAISFTGSAEVGRRISQVCARLGKRFQGEMGASNAALVLADADIDYAAQDLAAAMFSFAGQRCTAIRRIIVHEQVFDEFRRRMVEAVTRLRVGEPSDPSTQVGPVISLSVQRTLSQAIGHAVGEGARLVAQAPLNPSLSPHGAWLAPTVLENVPLDSAMWCDEQFGPVAVLRSCSDFEEAIMLHNSVQYGLLGVIYTRSSTRAREFARRAQVGLCSVNQARPPFSAQGPFVGQKDSGAGVPEHGRWNRDFYTQVQAVYDEGKAVTALDVGGSQ